MHIVKDIFRTFYPYAIFTLPSPLPSGEGRGEAAQCAYLTFDDGPIPEVTPHVLAILDRYSVKATFFMVGENIDKHPDLFAQVLAAGHSVGNHTYNHLKGWRTPYADYMANVHLWKQAAQRPLSAEGGLSAQRSILDQRSGLFRPPYGKATLRQRRAIHQFGYRLIYWDVLTRDYEATRTPEQMFAQIKRETRPGSIINFHDSLKSNERMLAVLPQAIDWLLQQGYTLLPL